MVFRSTFGHDIKDIPSLKGKVVGLMTKGASTDHGLTALLRQYNLRSGQDVKVLYLGGVREGLAALDRGIVSRHDHFRADDADGAAHGLQGIAQFRRV